MRLLPLVQYRDFRNEDGTYDEGVEFIINEYNNLVKKYNYIQYRRIIENILSENYDVHIPDLIEELKNYKPGFRQEEKKEPKSFYTDLEERVGKQILEDRKILEDSLFPKSKLFYEKINSQYTGKADPNQTATLKQEVQDGLGNYFDKQNISPTESFQRYVYGNPGFWDNIKNAKIDFVYTDTNLLKEDLEKAVSDCFKVKYTVKQINPDIQHIITPSENYFLFKLSK